MTSYPSGSSDPWPRLLERWRAVAQTVRLRGKRPRRLPMLAKLARSNLTAIVVAIFFVASLFLAPLAETVPTYATAPALLFVACLMATSLGAIGWDEPTEYIPALTIALMIPLSYSIATGIGLGFIAYVALKLIAGRFGDINGASAVIAGAFLLKLIFA